MSGTNSALAQLLGAVPGAGASPSLLALLAGQRQGQTPAVSPLASMIQPEQRAGGMNPMGLPAAQAPPNPGANGQLGGQGTQLTDLLKLLNQNNNQNQSGGGWSLMDWLSQLFGGGGSTFTPSPTGTYGGQQAYSGPTNVDAPTTYNF